MRILIIAPQFPPDIGGIAAYSYEVAKNLVRCGEQVMVLTAAPMMGSESVNQHGFKLFSIGWLRPIFKTRFLIGQVARIIAMFFYTVWICISSRVEIIYCTYYEAGVAARPISKLLGIPYFLTIHGTEISNLKSIVGHMVKFALDGSSGYFIQARRQRDSLLGLGISDSLIHVVPHGVDIKKFGSGSEYQETVNKHGLDGRKVILTVGNLVERKGHDMVLRCLPIVLEEVPNAVYLIIGDGKQRQSLMELVEKLDLSDYVIFTGRVPDKELLQYYNICDVFIMPSREIDGDIEGFGIVYLEANACSKPVIGGKSGGVYDAVQDGVSGILVDPLDVDEISQALITLLTDDQLAKKLGQQGRKRVEEEFRNLAMAEKLTQIFKNLLKKESALS